MESGPGIDTAGAEEEKEEEEDEEDGDDEGTDCCCGMADDPADWGADSKALNRDSSRAIAARRETSVCSEVV